MSYLFSTLKALSKEIQNYFISGIYSGIFALYLQCHASKETADNMKQKITFYALCVLYVLSAADFTLDTADVWSGLFVSINELLFFNFAGISCTDR